MATKLHNTLYSLINFTLKLPKLKSFSCVWAPTRTRIRMNEAYKNEIRQILDS